jgi:ribonuclease Z
VVNWKAMSGRYLTVLGIASQAPTRQRHHNGFVLRWDRHLLLFDPGEGCQRQCILAGVAINRLTAVCVTHFHGDHVLGLPGIIQQRSLDNRTGEGEHHPLPVLYPVEGQVYFDRLRHATVFHDMSQTEPHPITAEGVVMRLDAHTTLEVRALDHRIPTYGYRVQEEDRPRLNRLALAERQVSGPAVGRLLREGRVESPTGTVELDEVTEIRPGQSFALVMDTRPCPGATALAEGVDLLVCESTFIDHDAELAHRFHHLTARQAGELARDAGARRLVLAHFSSRYPSSEVYAAEASMVHPDVVAAEELQVIEVPVRARR